ncbi:hypothetical protein LXL04_021803 [Taraxacum kok-saghyz]
MASVNPFSGPNSGNKQWVQHISTTLKKARHCSRYTSTLHISNPQNPKRRKPGSIRPSTNRAWPESPFPFRTVSEEGAEQAHHR